MQRARRVINQKKIKTKDDDSFNLDQDGVQSNESESDYSDNSNHKKRKNIRRKAEKEIDKLQQSMVLQDRLNSSQGEETDESEFVKKKNQKLVTEKKKPIKNVKDQKAGRGKEILKEADKQLVEKPISKKQIKENQKIMDKACQDEQDQIPFIRNSHDKNEQQQIDSQVDSYISNSLIAKNFLTHLESLKQTVIKFDLNQTKLFQQTLFKYIKDILIKKNVPNNLCLEFSELFIREFTLPPPLIQRTMFFPNKQNEKELSYIIRRARKSLDIAVFAFTNDCLREAVLFAHSRGVKVRLISDDECSKFLGAEIYSLSLAGIECTTDNNIKAHMHNKYVIIDKIIIITGSFNWTSQAVTMNQENLIVIENPIFVKQYQENFDDLWVQFAPQLITKALSVQKLKEEQEKKDSMQKKANEARETKKQNQK